MQNVVVVVVWFGDPCESPGALLLKAAPECRMKTVLSFYITPHFLFTLTYQCTNRCKGALNEGCLVSALKRRSVNC